ncbi:MAG: peptide chain release factor N(5)-glutamine methyltransferase [Ignavibacteriales bacterium]|nr:peptide chain release factor N(5)-glutamine methyltransferase [Ignavibacteriales bacterium]
MTEEQDRIWTVRGLMKSAISLLQKRGFDEARLNVELLLSHALRCQRIELYTNFDKSVTQAEMEQFRVLYERRLRHEPVQYILGVTSFMGLQMKVDARVLIPRPETETLVEQTIMACNNIQGGSKIHILDLGTGSGNIAIALGKYLKNVRVTSVDNSAAALDVARKNIEEHGLQPVIDLKEMDIFEPLDQLLLRRFDILVSNPPYVAPDEWETLRPEVKDYEPRSATTDSHDGFEFYRRIFELSPYLLVDKGLALVEAGDGCAGEVAELMSQNAFEDISVVQDLQGTDRVVIGSRRAKSRNPSFSN